MTNLQELIGQEEAISTGRLASRWYRLVPLAAGGLLGIVLLGAWVIPTLQQLNEANQRLMQKQAKAAQVPVLRQQLEQNRQAEQRAAVQRSQLLALIAGSGDLATFLAQVDREAQRYGVQLDVLEPVAPPPPTKKSKKSNKAADAPAPADPLRSAGLNSESFTLAARADYPNLLAFLRGIERLSLLVRQSDLVLQLPGKGRGRGQKAGSPLIEPPTELSFKVTLYSQKQQPSTTEVSQATP